MIKPSSADVNDIITISPDNAYIVHEKDDSYTLWLNDKPVWEIPEESLTSSPHNNLEIIEGSD